MVGVRFRDDDTHTFTRSERDQIQQIADSTAVRIRSQIPLPPTVSLLVAASDDVLPTGDNAFAEPTGVIDWSVDPQCGVAAVADTHLSAAFAHEAFHVTRFARLPDEGCDTRLLNIAVNEGLATVFARDLTDVHEPWTDYDAAQAANWLTELERIRTAPAAQLHHWKFRHPDGREWITFRTGSWLVDQCRVNDSRTAADLVHTPAGHVLASATKRADMSSIDHT